MNLSLKIQSLNKIVMSYTVVQAVQFIGQKLDQTYVFSLFRPA